MPLLEKLRNHAERPQDQDMTIIIERVFKGIIETAVPEPSTLALFGMGILGLGLRRRRTKI
jgi:hypothetical protein